MTCQIVRKKLSAYQDRQLPPNEMIALREHLRNCPDCARQLQQLELVWDALAKVEQFDSAPFFWTKLSRRLNKTSEKKVWRQRASFLPRLLPIPVAAMLLLVFSLLTGFYLGKTLFFYATPGTETVSEIKSESLLAINSFDELSDESVTDVYQSIISDDTQ
ncbi:MAG: hypothetical protein GXO74_12050 [Calditrichaeota bacterium]|nr:hypothetical protein [Calditrichota bacterium]